jgi:hypothetical protein
MIDRINKNEERLDKILANIKELNTAIDHFKENKKDLIQLKRYYGSKAWFKDKELYEKGLISKVKAGVLSEDTVWNMLEDIDNLIEEMKSIVDKHSHQ